MTNKNPVIGWARTSAPTGTSIGTSLQRSSAVIRDAYYDMLADAGLGKMLVGSGAQYSIKAADAGCSVLKATGSKLVNVVKAVNSDFRFLPYRDNSNASMELDADAVLFLTGPLSGCNIYIGGTALNPIVCHTNSNQNANDFFENTVAKLTLAIEVLGPTVTGFLERNSSKGYSVNGAGTSLKGGFVIGRRPDKQAPWSFEYYGRTAGGGGASIAIPTWRK